MPDLSLLREECASNAPCAISPAAGGLDLPALHVCTCAQGQACPVTDASHQIISGQQVVTVSLFQVLYQKILIVID